jgi:hypothetical protein
LPFTGLRVNDDVGGLEVFVDEAEIVNLGDSGNDSDREREERRNRHWPAQLSIERLAAEIFQDQGRHALVGTHSDGLYDRGRAQLLPDLELRRQSPQAARPATPRIEHLEKDTTPTGELDCTQDLRAGRLVELLADVEHSVVIWRRSCRGTARADGTSLGTETRVDAGMGSRGHDQP